MNGAGLNLPGKTRVIQIDRISILNDDGMVARGFLGLNVRGSHIALSLPSHNHHRKISLSQANEKDRQ